MARLVPIGRRGQAKGKAKSRSTRCQLTGLVSRPVDHCHLFPPDQTIKASSVCCNLAVNTVRGSTFKSGDNCGFEEYIAKPECGKVAVNRVADYKQLLDIYREENR